MRLHTDKLHTDNLFNALFAAKDAGNIAESVYFDILVRKASHSKEHAYEIQLASMGKIPGDKRRYRNSGKFGAQDDYSATHDEWGFFITELYKLDRELTFGPYTGKEDFHEQTTYKYTDAYDWGYQGLIARG